MREENEEKESEMQSVSSRIGQADAYPKISRERKYKATETLTKRGSREKAEGEFHGV